MDVSDTLRKLKGVDELVVLIKKSVMVNKGFGKPHEYSRLQFSIL